MSTSKVAICNLALSHLGVGKEIASLETEKSEEASVCRRFYDICRETALRDFAWPFATKIDTLALIGENPNAEWQYSYRYPTDCLQIRKILSGTRNDTDDTFVAYKIAQDNAGFIIFTDKDLAEAEYTVNVTNTNLLTPDFVMSMSWLLSHYIAPRVTAGDPFNIGERAFNNYRFELSKAAANAFNEERLDSLPDSEFIRGRE